MVVDLGEFGEASCWSGRPPVGSRVRLSFPRVWHAATCIRDGQRLGAIAGTVALLLASVLASVPPTQASTPTLAGEKADLLGGLPFAPSYGPGNPPGCDPSMTSTVPFSATGTARGPFPGQITLTGTFSVAPQTMTVDSFNSRWQPRRRRR